MKLFKRIKIKYFVLMLAVPMLVIVIATAAVNASSQTFRILDNNVRNGMLVSLSANSEVVDPATEKNASSLLGIISNNTTDISYTPKAGQVSVQTDGQTSALVSTLGGDILIGDRIAPSSLAGIGSKISGNGWIVGIAQASLDSKTTGAVQTNVTDTKGKKHQVYVASIPIVVKVTYYTVPGTPSSPTSMPESIQKVADAIAGRHASLIGVLLSFLLLFIGVVTAGIIVNSSVRGTFVAVSRQPLSKASIFRVLARSLAVAAGILVAVFVVALLILRIL